MVVCKFWLQGNCRYGDSCKFEHPVANSNRFGVFGGPSGGSASVAATSKDPGSTYNITESNIVKDLTEDKPQWIFSSYAPGRNAPGQLFGGPQTEQSFEELRLHFWQASSSRNQQAAANDLDSLYRQTEQQIQNAVKSPGEALRYVLSAESQHPNRVDICKRNSLSTTTGEFSQGRSRMGQTQMAFGVTGTTIKAGPFTQAEPTAFGALSAAPSAAPFVQPAFGQHSFAKPAFGAPSFGQPALKPQVLSQASASQSAFGQAAFGQPSFGQPAFGQPAFGKPAAPNTTSVSPAFGQQTQLGGGSAFGQPSSLGQKSSAFGAPSFGQLAGGFSKFARPAGNQTSAFGQSQVNGTGAFAQVSQSAVGTTFGQPSGMASGLSPFATAGTTTASPFSKLDNSSATTSTQTAFGKTTDANANGSPFGASTRTGVFGKPAVPSNPFTQNSANATPNAFSQHQPAQNPFGTPGSSQAASTALGGGTAASAGGQSLAIAPALPNPFQTMQTKGTFGQPSTANVFGKQSIPTSAQIGAQAGANSLFSGHDAVSKAANEASQQADGHPAIDSYASRDSAGRLVIFKGKRVVYQQAQDGKELPVFNRPDGKTARIWFPNGPPPPNKDTEVDSDTYTAGIKAQYEAFTRTSRFEGGLIPELPPKRDWCLWDF